jgi:NADPH-dependent 2,4-dienoyl-CoA reductase/sulfur reductase-like enzyme
MPTLYTALKARHGQMSKAVRAARALEPGAELGRVLLSESVATTARKAGSGAEVIVIGAGFAGLAAAYATYTKF